MKRILYDISDFLHFFLGRAHPTGIQRVQIDVLLQLLENRENVIPVFYSSVMNCFCKVKLNRVLSRNSKYIRRINPTKLTLSRKSRAWLSLYDKKIKIESGDVIFVSGAASQNKERNTYLVGKANEGHSVVWTCYDLIPIRYPEFTGNGPVAKSEFVDWLNPAIKAGGKFICISQFVANDLRQYAKEIGHDVNAVAVPLAHEFSPVSGMISGNVAQLNYEKFVLFVSSMSIRKNQFGLVKLWMKLYRELGEDLPTLVLVGISWGMERLFKLLDGTGQVNGKVLYLPEVSDAELFHLYSKCDFTIFPSFYEGWGLPVGESLWMGKQCVSSNAASLPEVGRDHVTYFDPFDGADMETAIRQALKGNFKSDPPSREKLRTWRQVAADVAAEINNISDK